jgi:peptide-methionine (S)-S-oxide reductase
MGKLFTIFIIFWLSFSPVTYAQGVNIQKATFAGGCFWCMEKPFDDLNGVISTTSGYSGGNIANSTYKQVNAGNTGHAESVQVEYDATKVTYNKLLKVFWKNVDPTAKNKQFCDVGDQYRSAIFYQNDQQKKLAEQSRLEVKTKLKTEVFTEISALKNFYPAEEYHQDYYKKNSLLYKYYRYRCGRDQRLEEIWGQ